MMMEGGDQESPPLTCQRKKKDKNSRRFSDEQISSLESMFKMETKLEPRKKLQLARELGLQPRQVAIWFQNRRARWKSKQIEQEYRLLKSNYDNLSSRFDSLKNEKQSLFIQLQKLRGQLKNRDNEGRESKDVEGNGTDDSGSENGKKICEFEENPSCLRERLGSDVVVYSDDDDNLRNSRFPAQGEGEGEGEAELMKLGEQVDLSLVPQERWCNFETGTGLFDHTCNGSLNWWDFST